MDYDARSVWIRLLQEHGRVEEGRDLLTTSDHVLEIRGYADSALTRYFCTRVLLLIPVFLFERYPCSSQLCSCRYQGIQWSRPHGWSGFECLVVVLQKRGLA